MMDQRIVVYDPETEDCLHSQRILEQAGFAGEVVEDARELLEQIREERCELVVICVDLPDTDGFELCRRIRAVSDVPVVLIGAVREPRDVIYGFESGADDCLAKPYDPGELISRIRAILRRCGRDRQHLSSQPAPAMEVGPIEVDFAAQHAFASGTNLDLSAKELHLLYVLARNVGMLVNRNLLLEEVWRGSVGPGSKTLDVHMSRLRKKLDQVDGLGRYLKTIRNRGYLLSTDLLRAEDAAMTSSPSEAT